jgi:predicted glycosyltransferase
MDNITFIYDNTSVYDILSKSSFVIGVSSTVLLEAMIYHKIKIFVYTKEEHSVVQNFIDKGYMLGVSDSKELFNYIESNNNNKSKITIPSYEEVWKSNPDRNLRMALNEIL